MGLEDQNMVIRAALFAANVLTSTALVLVNKQLLTGYSFKYAATLGGFHLTATALANWLLGVTAGRARAEIPVRDLFMYIMLSSTSLIAVNTSLTLNSIAHYQVSKMAVLPLAALMDFCTIGKRHQQDAVASMILMFMGLAATFASNEAASVAGMAAASAVVVSVAAEQIGGEALRAHFQIDQIQLTARVLPVQAVLLLFCGPLLDKLLVGTYPHEYELHVPSMNMIAMSIGLAVVVNLSRYAAMSRLSPFGLDAMGFVKGGMTFLGGWFAYETVDFGRELAGAAPALLGHILYTFASSKAPAFIPNAMMRGSDEEDEEQADTPTKNQSD